LRRDLRLADNPALRVARGRDGDVAATFVVDERLLACAGRTRVAFLRRTLEELDNSIGGALCVRVGDPGGQLGALARELGARRVVATQDFTPYGRARDLEVQRSLEAQGVEVRYVDSTYVVQPGKVRTAQGTPCQVFGAFQRGWEREPIGESERAPHDVTWIRAPSESLDELERRCATRRPWYFTDLPDEPAASPPVAGEAAAHEQLNRFRALVDDYDTGRDRPGLDATSRLSAYLRFGSLHPRQVLHALAGPSSGSARFRSELCWRDFYADVLWHRPESAREVLQSSLVHLRVDDDHRALERFGAWARGETGFPIVDAGMRQLLAEGWMHNRVRMITASFLVKHLHVDWRWGARWFMWRLVDADLASNQHGWQWTAGTGTDAAPFHRIFNPTRQGERFDPDGEYVRRYVTELATVPAPQCLQPGGGSGLLTASGYVEPIIDLDDERREALVRFATARATVAS
jgi:deoxyribodipyrimidine photo-lyase